MKTKVKVPLYLQYDSNIEMIWQPRCGGVVCVKMVIDCFSGKNDLDINYLITEGLTAGGNDIEGWPSNVLTDLLRSNGIPSYVQEFKTNPNLPKEEEIEEKIRFNDLLFRLGIEKIHREIRWEIPVIVSVSPGFRENQREQLIVISGCFEDDVGLEGFFFHDPSQKSYWPYMSVEMDYFQRFWNGKAIFIDK